MFPEPQLKLFGLHITCIYCILYPISKKCPQVVLRFTKPPTGLMRWLVVWLTTMTEDVVLFHAFCGIQQKNTQLYTNNILLTYIVRSDGQEPSASEIYQSYWIWKITARQDVKKKSPCRVQLDVRIEHYQENWVETTALFQQLACLTN